MKLIAQQCWYVPNEKSYESFVRQAESQGITWRNGRKASQVGYSKVFDNLAIVVEEDDEKTVLGYGGKQCFEEEGKNIQNWERD